MARKSASSVKQKDLQRRSISLTVNGKVHELEVGMRPDQVDPAHTLAFTLRETLGLTGTKIACDGGACGCCTVLMDGKAVLSCMTLTIECNGKSVTTIEGLKRRGGNSTRCNRPLSMRPPFNAAFARPGIIMSAKWLLSENSSPTEEEVKEALSGNFCRCISHYHVVRAVMAAAHKTDGRGEVPEGGKKEEAKSPKGESIGQGLKG